MTDAVSDDPTRRLDNAAQAFIDAVNEVQESGTGYVHVRAAMDSAKMIRDPTPWTLLVEVDTLRGDRIRRRYR